MIQHQHRVIMKITLKLFAMLRDKLPPGNDGYAVQIEVEPGTTANQIIDRFEILPEMAHLVMIDGYHLLPDERACRPLKEGEVLAIFPPIAGG